MQLYSVPGNKRLSSLNLGNSIYESYIRIDDDYPFGIAM